MSRLLPMEPLPAYIETWVLKRTGERHYLCRLCGGPNDDHGSEVFFRRHLQTTFHLNKVRHMESLYCTVCNLRFEFDSKYKRHISSTAHRHKADPSTKPVFHCDACDMPFRCRAEEIRHLATAKHRKNVSKTDSGTQPPLASAE